MHIKFDHIFGFQNQITSCASIVASLTKFSPFMQPTNMESHATYRLRISYIKREMLTIMWMDVFCVHKPGFLMPGHIYIIRIGKDRENISHNSFTVNIIGVFRKKT